MRYNYTIDVQNGKCGDHTVTGEINTDDLGGDDMSEQELEAACYEDAIDRGNLVVDLEECM